MAIVNLRLYHAKPTAGATGFNDEDLIVEMPMEITAEDIEIARAKGVMYDYVCNVNEMDDDQITEDDLSADELHCCAAAHRVKTGLSPFNLVDVNEDGTVVHKDASKCFAVVYDQDQEIFWSNKVMIA